MILKYKDVAKELGCSYHKILKVISRAEFAKYRCTTLLPQERKTFVFANNPNITERK